jgi:hypothetical protein
MILNKEQIDSFEEAAKPLIKWLNENCHPHMTVVVETNGAELLEGVCNVQVHEFIKD